MRKSIVFVFLCAFLMFFSACSSDSDNSKVTINVYNWGEYISTGVDDTLDTNEEFTKQTGIKVNYSTFASNEELYAKLSSNGAVYDVIIPSDYLVSKLINQGMLKELDLSKIPNYKYIDDEFKGMDYDSDEKYSVAYTWGHTGIFYNSKYVDIDPDDVSWDILWDEKYKDKILMFDNPRDAFAISQFLLGFNINSNDKDEWLQASELLKTQKPVLQSYVMDQIFNKLGNNEAWIAPYYSGDLAQLQDNNEDIEFALPKEGTNLFVDAMCIPANCTHYEEALQYINFMCEPEVALANIEATGYSSPSSAVKDMLDEEVAESEVLYPDMDTIENAQVFTDLPDDIAKYADELWINVKTGTQNNPIALVFVLLAFLAVYIAIIVYKKVKNRY